MHATRPALTSTYARNSGCSPTRPLWPLAKRHSDTCLLLALSMRRQAHWRHRAAISPLLIRRGRPQR